MRKRVRGLLVRGGLLCLSLLIALLMGEALVRIFAPQQLILKRPDVWKAQDGLGWVHRPNLNTRINTGERTVDLHTDEEGFRVSRTGRVEASTRILLLGDSFMEALQVQYRNSVAGLLERHLPKELGRRVSVRNTAVGGWEPSQYLLQARSSLDREKYDLVIVSLYLKNDILEDRRDSFPPRTPTEVHRLDLPDRFTWDAFVDSVLYPVNDFLEVRSQLFQLVKRRGDVLLMRMGLSAAYFPAVYRESEADSRRWTVTAEILSEIAGLAAENSIPTIVLLIPGPGQVNDGALERHLAGLNIDPATVDTDQPARLLGQRLEAEGLLFVDASDALNTADSAGVRQYGRVDRHLTPAGHETVAEVLIPPVVDALDGVLGARISNSSGRFHDEL